jgi:hypothetical protein
VPYNDVGGSGAQMAMTIDFFDYGVEPDIEPPSDDETFDATEMMTEGSASPGIGFG